MSRFTRAKMNRQMTRDERAERAIKRMPIITTILMVISVAFLLVAYYMHFEELYIGDVQVLSTVLVTWTALLRISFLVMSFKFAYHRGFRIKTLLAPICQGIACCIPLLIILSVDRSVEYILYIEMGAIVEEVSCCAIPGALGVVLGWISRLLFRRRDI